MAELLVRDVHKAFGPVRALAGVTLAVPSGTLFAVVGPSGCGKTTLLRCVAGFERVDAGEITVDGRVVTGLPAHRRRIAIVPQEAALFPHLSVHDNVAYGLDRARRRDGRVEAVLSLVGLDGYGTRMPHQLSGGQQQRVAVARALAPRPPLLLLDEPFSALDAALRVEVRRDVREALRADGATAVLVTHDQGEALALADRVAVMRSGAIVQSGTPAGVYAAPADTWVASFVGEAVLLPASVRDGVARTALGDIPLAGPDGAGPDGARPDGAGPDGAGAGSGLDGAGSGLAMVRPEQLRLRPGPGDGVRATVVRRDFHGHDSVVALRLADGIEVAARIVATEVDVTVGDTVTVRVQGPARLYPAP